MSNENEDTVSESCVLHSDDADGFDQSSDSEESSSASEDSISARCKDEAESDGNTEPKKNRSHSKARKLDERMPGTIEVVVEALKDLLCLLQKALLAHHLLLFLINLCEADTLVEECLVEVVVDLEGVPRLRCRLHPQCRA
jgi:hypothetical protein